MADLRLEDDDQRENYVWQQRAEQPVEGTQVAPPREIEREPERSHSHQHRRRPRPTHQHQELVDQDRDQNNVQNRNGRDHRDVGPYQPRHHATLTSIVKSEAESDFILMQLA